MPVINFKTKLTKTWNKFHKTYKFEALERPELLDDWINNKKKS